MKDILTATEAVKPTLDRNLKVDLCCCCGVGMGEGIYVVLSDGVNVSVTREM